MPEDPRQESSPKPYLTRAELARLVGRWTPKTVSRLIRRGVFRQGEHFFLDPGGRGYLFRWEKIVDVIESAEARFAVASPTAVPMLTGGYLGDGNGESKTRRV